MSIDYSQFYRGTTGLTAYGNGQYKKDSLVKYEFNTTDEKGNKIMDKMTKEETMQAVNNISKQYGDNVIVEFSGDGMAALIEDKKVRINQPLTEEQLVAKATRQEEFEKGIIHNENVHHVLDESLLTKMAGAPEDYVDMDSWLKENDEDLYNQMNDLNQRIINRKPGDNNSAEFIELMKKVNSKMWSAKSTKTESTQKIENTQNTEIKLSKKAQKLLDDLSKKYGNMDFFVSNFSNGTEAKALLANSTKEYSVMFTAEELEKMASDDNYKEENLNKVERLIDFSDRINKKYGFTSAGDNPIGNIVSKYGLTLNDDGTISLFAELTNNNENKIKTITASSEDELLGLIGKIDWSKVKDEK